MTVITCDVLRHMVQEQLETSPEYEKIRRARATRMRGEERKDNIMDQDLRRLARGVTEAILPIVENILTGDLLREDVDLKKLVKQIRQEIYRQILATISDIELARKGQFRNVSR